MPAPAEQNGERAPLGGDEQAPSAGDREGNGGAAARADGLDPHGPSGAWARAKTLGAHSSFCSADLSKLSSASSQSMRFQQANTAVNVTRTVSIDQKQWDRLQAQPAAALRADEFHNPDGRAASKKTRQAVQGRFRSILGLPMIDPFSRFSLSWHMLMLVMDLTYTAFLVPIGVGFDVSDTAWTWVAVCDFTAGFIFLVDLILGFHTGYIVSFNYRKRVVMDGRQVARFYALQGSCWVDALSSVAWVTQVVLVLLTVSGRNQETLASQIQIIRLLRLARLGRLVRVLFLSSSGQGLLPLLLSSQKVIGPTLGYFLQLLYAIGVTINFIGCLWYWTADLEGIEDTWITAFQPFVERYGDASGVLTAAAVAANISKPQLYLASVYWAFTTVATIGYGDITPQTAAEQGVALVVFLAGLLFFGVLIGSLTQLLQKASKEARRAQLYRDKMEGVEGWLRQRRFPNELRKRIRAYYAQFWLGLQAEEADEAEMLGELPHGLRTEAVWSMAHRSLAESPVLGSLPVELQFVLAQHLQPRKLPPGHDLCLQGGAPGRIWLLHLGQVAPVVNDMEGAVQMGPRLLNAAALLQELHPRFQRTLRGYRTLTACGLWEWSVGALLSVCRHHQGMYEHICRGVCEQLRAAAAEEGGEWPGNLLSILAEVERRLEQKQQLQAARSGSRTASGRLAPASPFAGYASNPAPSGAQQTPARREQEAEAAAAAEAGPPDSRRSVRFAPEPEGDTRPYQGSVLASALSLLPQAQGDQAADEAEEEEAELQHTEQLQQLQQRQQQGLRRRRSAETRLSLAAGEGEEAEAGGEPGEEEPLLGQRGAHVTSLADVAALLSDIQDQLAELRQHARRFRG